MGTTLAPTTTTLYSITSSFESYANDYDVSGDGVWQTGVTYNSFVVKYGSTSSSRTGPYAAYSGSYYAYCETTSPNYPGAYFDLQTTEFSSGISSITFYYMA